MHSPTIPVRSRRPHALWVVILAGVCLLPFACRGKAGETAEAVATPAYEPLAVALILDPRYQPEVKMLARAEGETVDIELQSLTQTPIFVEAQNFGIIHEKYGRQVIHFDPQIHRARFPKVGVEFGQRVSGSITFTGLGELSGQKLVFYHTKTKPSVTLIQGKNAPDIAVPVPSAALTPIPGMAGGGAPAPTPLPLGP